jgi:hypothetical protein
MRWIGPTQVFASIVGRRLRDALSHVGIDFSEAAARPSFHAAKTQSFPRRIALILKESQ